jgi:hypothetical protein
VGYKKHSRDYIMLPNHSIEEIIRRFSLLTPLSPDHAELYCIALWKGYRVISERKEIMKRIIEQQANIKRTHKKIFALLTQCIADIQKTVKSSGLKMQDVGSESKNTRQAWILSSMI